MKMFSWPDNPISNENLRNVAEEAERSVQEGNELYIMPESVAAIARELLEYRLKVRPDFKW